MTPQALDPAMPETLHGIIRDRSITVQFQPIIQAKGPVIHGYEALVRGPSDSWLHSPLVLLEAALDADLLVEMELMMLRQILETYRALQLPGLLFVNMSTDTMLFLHGRTHGILGILAQIGVPSENLVVELTETRPCFDTERLEITVRNLLSLGIRVAIDDLGEGFASLKRWSIIKPDYVKIDRHFVEGIHKDPVLQQFIKSVLDIAKVANARVIAEGVEQAADLQTLLALGMDLVQGYLLARPDTQPRTNLSAETTSLLGPGRRFAMTGHDLTQHRTGFTAADIAHPGLTVHATTPLSQVLAHFQADHGLGSLPVLDDNGFPVGILRSLDFLATASKPYFHEVYGRRECQELMDTKPLIFDHRTDVRAMSEVVATMDDRHLVDGFIVTKDGRYLARGRMTDLIKAVSEMQVFAARYANPLTFLPGNVPIDEELSALLDQRARFTIAYWDLNDFKPYNDVYGYAQGDQVIRFTASVLGHNRNPDRDFLGHVGGDDFVTIYLSPDCQPFLDTTLRDFDQGIVEHLRPDHVSAGGYHSTNRRGEDVFHPLVSLCAGVLQVDPGMFTYPSEVAQAVSTLKKLAKRQSGSSLFVERRTNGREAFPA